MGVCQDYLSDGPYSPCGAGVYTTPGRSTTQRLRALGLIAMAEAFIGLDP